MEYFRKDWLFTIKDFPIFINHDIPLKNTCWHTHDFFEIVLVGSGHAEHQIGDGRSFGIMQGDVFAIPVGQVHRYVNTSDMYLYNILFEPSFLSGDWEELQKMPILFSLLNPTNCKFHLSLFTRASAELLLRRIMGELRMRPPALKISIKAMFMEFLVLLGRSQAREFHAFNYKQQAIHRAIIFMEKNLGERITLQDISRHANMNKNYFSESFHLETGTSPWDYLLLLRIENVKKLLCETDLPISEVAQKSGFCDQSYMSRVFKAHEGRTPNKFRSAYLGK